MNMRDFLFFVAGGDGVAMLWTSTFRPVPLWLIAIQAIGMGLCVWVACGLTQRAPDGLTPEQSEQVRQMIQNALDTGSA